MMWAFKAYIVFFVVWFVVMGCDETQRPRSHRGEVREAQAYCSNERVLEGEGMHPCSNTLGNKEACRRANYKRCLRSYR